MVPESSGEEEGRQAHKLCTPSMLPGLPPWLVLCLGGEEQRKADFLTEHRHVTKGALACSECHGVRGPLDVLLRRAMAMDDGKKLLLRRALNMGHFPLWHQAPSGWGRADCDDE